MNSGHKSILVVDDEELNLDMLSRRLTRTGFKVQVARSGREALALISQCEFALILLDHMMPEMSGREVLNELRKMYTPAALPIIMVTAVAESDKIAEALEAGANDYVTKPIDYKIALARIQVQLARRDAEMALRISEQRYALAAEASRDALWDWNLVEDSIFFSSRWMEMAALPAISIQGQPDLWFSRVFKPDIEGLELCIRETRDGLHQALNCDYRLLDNHGDLRWMSCRAIATYDAAGRAVRLSGSQSDVTEERTRDSLTGLLNRLAIVCRLEQLFLFARQKDADPKSGYAVLFLDLDGFKTVNDSLGHLAGDQLLCVIADRLRSAVSTMQSDGGAQASRLSIARMGGDEFAVLVESASAFDDACRLAGLVQEEMMPPAPLSDRTVRCAFSVGVAASCEEHKEADEIIHDADVAMYTAKAAGRGRMMAFTPTMRKAALDRLDLENDLCEAIAKQQMRLVYQPKVRLDTGAVYGVEALIRWDHPLRGVISPATFIPIAERTGAIRGIGQFVLRAACAQIAQWQNAYAQHALLELSVNLSPSEFRQDDLVQNIQDILMETGYRPELLHLEITEGVLFENMTAARDVLASLRRLGVLIDLDDFGSGYSSLRYLRELPFDTIKIDRYFISALDSGAASSAELIHTILAMARTLELDVVAEGIETMPHSTVLQQMGCRYGQGYFYSEPVPPEAMEAILVRECERAKRQEFEGKPRKAALRLNLLEAV